MGERSASYSHQTPIFVAKKIYLNIVFHWLFEAEDVLVKHWPDTVTLIDDILCSTLKAALYYLVYASRVSLVVDFD